ncbi:MAG: neocarzinostatin apoprotein domain-containing protein [Acidimicrobiales bacterium]
MLLLLLPDVALGVAVAYAAGGRRIALAVGTAGVVLLVVGSVAAGVSEVRVDRETGGRTPADAPVELPDEADGAPTVPPLRQVDLVLGAPGDAFERPDSLGRITDGDVRVVEVRVDFDDDRRVSLHQCAALALTAERCAEGVDATAGVDGSRTVLVEFDRRIATAAGPVDCAEEACVLAVFAGATPLFDVPLAFDAEVVTRPRVTVTPATGLRPGQEVTVTVTGLPAGADGSVTFCAAAEAATRPRCLEVDPAPLAADRDGRATTTVRLARCPRVERCALQVSGGAAPPTYAELAFASPPGPDLDEGRVGAGLAAAGGLLLAAVVLVRRSDWEPPGGDPFTGIDLRSDDPFAGIDLTVDPDDR